MLVTVRLFARLREIADAGELPMELPDGATVRDAWQALAARNRGIEPYASSVSCAVNADYSKMNAPLTDGDEVAFLPPVSGG
jgi:molybdopterin converting factor subunit 1